MSDIDAGGPAGASPLSAPSSMTDALDASDGSGARRADHSPGDVIELRGLRVSAICGALPEERTRPQPLEIDLDVLADLVPSGASDDLDDTVDYGALCDRVVAVATAGSPRLLEHLAAQIAAAVLADFRVREVVVAVRKLRPPVPHLLASSGVRIRRGRTEPSA